MSTRFRRLSYRCPGGTSLESASAHWRGFSYSHGNTQVIYRGPWGQMQVWAAGESEGRRVIAHACSHANIDINDPFGRWSVNEVSGGRFGGGGTCRVAEQDGRALVTVRNGPDGLPEIT